MREGDLEDVLKQVRDLDMDAVREQYDEQLKAHEAGHQHQA
jgi:hypothetical protein